MQIPISFQTLLKSENRVKPFVMSLSCPAFPALMSPRSDVNSSHIDSQQFHFHCSYTFRVGEP